MKDDVFVQKRNEVESISFQLKERLEISFNTDDYAKAMGFLNQISQLLSSIKYTDRGNAFSRISPKLQSAGDRLNDLLEKNTTLLSSIVFVEMTKLRNAIKFFQRRSDSVKRKLYEKKREERREETEFRASFFFSMVTVSRIRIFAMISINSN